jgi:hypothetical protein
MLVAFASPSGASDEHALRGNRVRLQPLRPLHIRPRHWGGRHRPTPITVGGNQVRHVTGIANTSLDRRHVWIDELQPVTFDCFGSNYGDATLVTINKATGVATVVGSVGAVNTQGADLTFDPSGNLYAVSGCADFECDDWVDVYKVNTTTGVGTKVGELGDEFDGRNGLAADSLGRMYQKNRDALYRVNQFTGHRQSRVALSNSNTQNILSFGPATPSIPALAPVPASRCRRSTSPPVPSPTLGRTVSSMSRRSSGRRPTRSPTRRDLSLTKIVNDATPLVDDEVTFTITVHE